MSDNDLIDSAIAEMQEPLDLMFQKVFDSKGIQKDNSVIINTHITTSQQATSNALTNDADIFNTMFSAKNGKEVEALYRGNTAGYASQSEADLAFCNSLAFYTGKDATTMDRLFRSSQLFRSDKWDRHAGSGETYGQRTIRCAIEGTTDVYGNMKDKRNPKLPTPKVTREEFLERINAVEDAQGKGFEELTVNIHRDVALSGLPQAHIDNLLKLLAKKTKTSVSSLRTDMKNVIEVHSKAQKEKKHQEAAHTVIYSYGEGNILYHQGWFWIWDGTGKWKKMHDREVKQRIHAVCGSDELTRSVVDSILDLCKTECFVSDHRFNINPENINCINGELHYKDGSYHLQPHSKENFSTIQIPIIYNPKAKALRFVQFLDEIFMPDDDKDLKKQITLEGIGYTLLSSSEYEKFLLLIGQGANGKSVLLNTVANIVGSDNVAAVQPSQFNNRFQRAHLQDKLANLISELSKDEVLADAELKAITSGELLTAEHKFKPPFEFHVFATCWFGSNYMPRTRDISYAFFRRAIILTFNRTFAEHEQDKKLKTKLKAELSGILNLAIGALAGVHRRGGFTATPSMEIEKMRMRSTSDHLPDFVNECCELGPNYTVESGRMYEAYQEWARQNDIAEILRPQKLTMRLKDLGISPHKGGKGIRLLVGIRIYRESTGGGGGGEDSQHYPIAEQHKFPSKGE